MGIKKKNKMSNTFTKIINIIFIAYFLMPAFSSIKLSNNKALSGKKSIDIEPNMKSITPVKIQNILQKISPNSTNITEVLLNQTQKNNIENTIKQDVFSAENLVMVRNRAGNKFGPQLKKIANKLSTIANNTSFLQTLSPNATVLPIATAVLPSVTAATPSVPNKKQMDQINADIKQAKEMVQFKKVASQKLQKIKAKNAPNQNKNTEVDNNEDDNNEDDNSENVNNENNNGDKLNNANKKDLIQEIKNKINNKNNGNKLNNNGDKL